MAHPKPRKWTPKFPHKYAGDVNNIVARSSWEVKFFNWCDNNPAVVKYASEEIIIPYLCPTDSKMHRYFVDALIKVKNNLGQEKTYLVEIKPYAQTIAPVKGKKKSKTFLNESLVWMKNDAKWKAARIWCAQRGIEFIILTEREIYNTPHK